jgi:DNA-binding MarR family transcriptional regulator
MATDDSRLTDPPGEPPKHPPAQSILDVVSFRLSRLVAINTKAGQHWSEKLFGLSLNEWWILGVTQAKGPLRLGDLAEVLAMDKSQLTRVMRTLLDRKLIKSIPDPADSRAVIVRLTKKGVALHDEILAEVLRRNENVLRPLESQEVIALSGLLDRLIAHNSELLNRMQNPDQN